MNEIRKDGHEMTAARLRELFTYSPETGQWSRNIRRGRQWPGPITLRVTHKTGYLHLRLGKKSFLVHRLAWLYVHGVWPSGDIDHVNGDKTDNRLCNLRDVDRRTNLQNARKARSDSKTGLLGAHPRKGKFISVIKDRGKTIQLGVFATAEEAHEKYLQEKRIRHAGCTI